MLANDTDPDTDLLTVASFSATSAHGGTIVAQDIKILGDAGAYPLLSSRVHSV
jgi:hypothetical protein